MSSIHRRMWLEPKSKEGVDSYWRVDADPVPKRRNQWRGVDLRIADCTRSVGLGFDYRTEKERQAMLKKLDRLQEGLNQVRKALEAGAPNV